ncbi:MAG: hypothetical protein JWL63_1803 [Rhodocyclales bacterium]|nr:hypothetical protein [Rhodocyclales bacterium]
MSAVNVFVSNEPAGTISHSDLEEDTFLFHYASSAREHDAVSLTMPVVEDQYDSMGMIHPIFEMNLPEGALRRALELKFAKVIPDFDSLGLLSIVGRSQIGRLRYGTGTQPEEAQPTQSVAELLSYKGAEDFFAALLERFAAHSGVSGMQPKVLVRDGDEGQYERLTDKGATHIVKSFDPNDYPELAANEFFSMKAAQYAGLPIPPLQLSANRRMLVIERFDRNEDGTYLGFEDFCVLMGLRAGGRYDRSYEELAQKIKVYVSPEHHSGAMRQLFGTVVLACAIKNGDAHLKNFAILYDLPGENVRLAPVYDMLSTAPYVPKDVLALTLSGKKAYPSRDELVRYGRQCCGLSARQTEQILLQVATGIRQALDELRIYAEEKVDFRHAASHFQGIFEVGIEFLTSKANEPDAPPIDHAGSTP